MPSLDTGSNKVIFVFLGAKLPRYAIASLLLAEKYSGLTPVLIGNASQERQVDHFGKVQFFSTEDFYDPALARTTSSFLLSDSTTREGLWVKSLERFFVLYQFAKWQQQHVVFHAELDQILCRADLLIQNLEGTQRTGVFFPFHKPGKAVASVLYCNKISALGMFLDYAMSGRLFHNEMELLADWATEHPEFAIALPTPCNDSHNPTNDSSQSLFSVTSKHIDGVVDAAQIGQWVAGIDPRNLRWNVKPVNKFISAPSKFMLSNEVLWKCSLRLDSLGRMRLTVGDNPPITLYNLHIHSKIHSTVLYSKNQLGDLLRISNSDKEFFFLEARIFQLIHSIQTLTRRMLKDPSGFVRQIISRLLRLLNVRPASYPFVSGDSFRKAAHHVWENTSRSIQWESIRTGDVIFCQADLAHELDDYLKENVGNPVVILLGNSDRNFTVHNHHNFQSKVSKVFAQNLNEAIPDYEVLPIGIENAWRLQNGCISLNSVTSSDIRPKVFRVFWSFSISTNPRVRISCALALRNYRFAEHLPTSSVKEHQSRLRKYAFVACPPGNGLDTHRMWEALYFRSVPVVLRSYLTEYYAGIGLPLLVLDSYDDLHKLDATDLQEIYLKMHSGFDCSAVWFDFWQDKIQSASRHSRSQLE
jgi:hypothetical protein